MKDRFNLEDEISTLYNFADHLDTISTGILEHGLNEDETVNAIIGVGVLLKLQANKLHDTMCQCFNLSPYDTNV